MEIAYKLSYGLTTVSGLVLGLFVLVKNPKSRVNVTWALTCFAVALWAVEGYTYYFERESYTRALLIARLCVYVGSIVPVFFTHFCLAFLGKPLTSSRIAIAAYLFQALLGCFVLSPLFIPTVEPSNFGILYYPRPGILFTMMVMEFIYLVFYSHWLLFRHLHHQTLERQNQIRYVATGTIIGFACGMSTFLPIYGVPFNPIPSMFTPIYAPFITYAIVKHRLMDIRVVFRRSVVYSVLITIIVGTYLVAIVIMERMFEGLLGYKSVLVSSFVAFLIALFFNPLRQRIQTVVDRALFKGTADELASQREQLLVEIRRGEQMKAVGTLAAGLAHEIKNPLASIKTFTEHLDKRYSEPEFREKFQRIVGGEVERINLIVQQLLDFAKPVPPKLELLELPRLLDDTLQFLNNEFIQRHVEVRKQYDWSGRILGDSDQLKQVFLNLFLNSLQAMDGNGRLEVGTSTEGNELLITVSDNGRGIDPKDIERIFEPFFTEKMNGTGLGLAVVRSIVNEHRGRVEAENLPGRGACFKIYLPLTAKL